jgi:hypothetical protein
MKTCTKCNIEKPLMDFYKNKSSMDGLTYQCKLCCIQQNTKFKLANPNYQKDWKLKNKDSITQYNTQWHQSNPDYHQKWYLDNKDYKKQYNSDWYLNNRESSKQQNQQYTLQRIKTDPIFKLSHNVRNLIGKSFKRSCEGTYKKGKKTEYILGCTLEEFTQYLQSQFKPGMTLENHGQGPGKWNMDHIIPISFAKTEEEIYKLNHYTNFQPLWWEENMAKGVKRIGF